MSLKAIRPPARTFRIYRLPKCAIREARQQDAFLSLLLSFLFFLFFFNKTLISFYFNLFFFFFIWNLSYYFYIYHLYFYDITLIIPYTLYFFIFSILSEKVESDFRVLLKIIKSVQIFIELFSLTVFIPRIIFFNFSINFDISTQLEYRMEFLPFPPKIYTYISQSLVKFLARQWCSRVDIYKAVSPFIVLLRALFLAWRRGGFAIHHPHNSDRRSFG